MLDASQLMVFKLLQLANASLPILVTLFPIVMLVKLVHL